MLPGVRAHRDRVFLHAGPPKTGSTALQFVMGECRERLSALGFVVAELDGNVNISLYADSISTHPEPGEPRLTERSIRSFEDEMVVHLRGASVIVSGESFAHLTIESLKRFRDTLAAGSYSVLMVLRPLDRLLPSLWHERVRHGLTLNFNDYLREVIANPSEAESMSQAATLRRLQAVFGRDGVVVTARPSVRRDVDSLVWVLEAWLGLAAGYLDQVSDLDMENRHGRMSQEELVAQVIFNHVISTSDVLPSQFPRIFAREFRSSREIVNAYLERGYGEVKPLLWNLAISEWELIQDLRPLTLESTEEFNLFYVESSGALNSAD